MIVFRVRWNHHSCKPSCIASGGPVRRSSCVRHASAHANPEAPPENSSSDPAKPDKQEEAPCQPKPAGCTDRAFESAAAAKVMPRSVPRPGTEVRIVLRTRRNVLRTLATFYEHAADRFANGSFYERSARFTNDRNVLRTKKRFTNASEIYSVVLRTCARFTNAAPFYERRGGY